MDDKNIDFHKAMEIILLTMLRDKGRISASTYTKVKEELKKGKEAAYE